jgi:hypothetical protein
MKFRIIVYGIWLILVGTVSGCAALQPLSNYARTGDTVAVALSQTEPNVTIRTEQTTATLTDAANVNRPVRVRHVFRVYSDPTSAYSRRSVMKSGWDSSNVPMETYSNPYQGQWVAIVDLVDPTTGAAPAFATGTAKLVVNWPSGASNQNDLEILPGTGQSNPLHGNYFFYNYDPIGTLEQMPQVQVTFSGTASAPLGGASLTFTYNTANFGGSHTAPWVTIISPDPNIQLYSSRRDLGNGNTELKATVLNPYGFKTDNDFYSGIAEQMSLRRDLRLTVAWDKSLNNITDANWQGSLQLTGYQLFDLNGSAVSGFTPVLTKLR